MKKRLLIKRQVMLPLLSAEDVGNEKLNAVGRESDPLNTGRELFVLFQLHAGV